MNAGPRIRAPADKLCAMPRAIPCLSFGLSLLTKPLKAGFESALPSERQANAA